MSNQTAVRMALKEQQAEKAAIFAKSFKKARSELTKLSDEGARKVIQRVNEFRQDILERLRRFSPADPRAPFAIRILPILNEEINAALEELGQRAGRDLSSSLENGFNSGARAGVQALRDAGIPLAFPSVSPEILVTISEAAFDIFDEIISDLGAKITTQVQQAAVSLQPISTTLRNVENLIKTSTEVRRGLRRRIGVGFQAESIVRTEVQRIHSVAQQAASEQTLQVIPNLRKRWLTGIRVRRGHIDAQNEYAPDGNTGPIPIRQRFRVTDFSRTGTTSFITVPNPNRAIRVPSGLRRGRPITDRMLHPRDPSASPGNVINCTCTVLEVVPDLEEATDRALGVVR